MTRNVIHDTLSIRNEFWTDRRSTFDKDIRITEKKKWQN